MSRVDGDKTLMYSVNVETGTKLKTKEKSYGDFHKVAKQIKQEPESTIQRICIDLIT